MGGAVSGRAAAGFAASCAWPDNGQEKTSQKIPNPTNKIYFFI
jgi:hypothetical protein